MNQRKITLDINLINALRKFLPSRAEEIIANPELFCTPFSGGFSGRSPFKLTIDDKMYVVRQLNPNVDNDIQALTNKHNKATQVKSTDDEFLSILNKYRDVNLREITGNHIADDNKIGPKIHYQDSLVIITDLAAGTPINSNDYMDPVKIAEVIKSLTKLHSAPVDQINVQSSDKMKTLTVTDRCGFYLHMILDHDAGYSKLFHDIDTKMKKLDEAMTIMATKLNIPTTWVHADFWGSNILYDASKPNDERVSLIDWTDCGLGNPYYDLAYFLNYGFNPATNKILDDDYTKKLLRGYEMSSNNQSNADNHDLFEYLKVMREFCYLRQGLWALSMLVEKNVKYDPGKIADVSIDELRRMLYTKETSNSTTNGLELLAKCYLKRFMNDSFVDDYVERASRLKAPTLQATTPFTNK